MIKAHRPVMGTMASVWIRADGERSDRAAAGIDATFAELERLEAMFSTFRPDSEISQVDRGERHVLDCSPEVIDVLDACAWLEQRSGGAFDIHRAGSARIDPAGFVKGWATERAARCLTDAGLANWYLSVGGDIVVSGAPSPEEPWAVAIAHPMRPREVVATFDVRDGAVATSGTAERGAHLWDGRTGHLANGWASVTVSGPSLSWADAFATTAFVMGDAGPRWVEQFDDYAVVAVGWDGEVRVSGGVATPWGAAAAAGPS